MKLISMSLENFRQFYGVQKVLFATREGDRNVTVFHGFNGAGKTAFLNAFVWGLYGKTTEDLEAPECLENEAAWGRASANAIITVRVRLQFQHDGIMRVVERSQKVQKQKKETGEFVAIRQPPDLEFFNIDHNENLQLGGPKQTYQDRINKLLPEGLYPFFFFNGERAERLASPMAYKDVEKGIKTLLKLELRERAVRHLETLARPDIQRQLKQYGGQEFNKAIKIEEDIKKRIHENDQRLEEINQNREKIQIEIQQLEQAQAKYADLAAYAEARRRLRQDQAKLTQRKQEISENLRKKFSENGFLAFFSPLFEQTQALFDEARQRGELPAKIKPQFVDDLLLQTECICGRALHEEERAHLLTWKSRCGLAEHEALISQSATAIGFLEKRRSDYFEELDRLQKQIDEVNRNDRSVREQLSKVDEKLLGGEDPEAGNLASRIAKLRNQEKDFIAEQALLKRDIDEASKRLQETAKEIKKLRMEDQRAALLQRQINAVDSVIKALQDIAELEKHRTREELNHIISRVWQDAAIKDYQATITPDYRLELTKRIDGEVEPVRGASTGEKQVLALAFIASLVKKMEQDQHKHSTSAESHYIPSTDGEYPLVMDSPFGSLEDIYRDKVAYWIPQLAHQVVMMVSKTQWRVEVERAVQGRIGRQYILRVHTTKVDANQTIELNGQEHIYVLANSEGIEYTQIIEISNME